MQCDFCRESTAEVLFQLLEVPSAAVKASVVKVIKVVDMNQLGTEEQRTLVQMIDKEHTVRGRGEVLWTPVRSPV